MTLSEKRCYDAIEKDNYKELLESKGFIIQTAMDNYNHNLVDKYYERLYSLRGDNHGSCKD